MSARNEWTKEFHEIGFHRELPCEFQSTDFWIPPSPNEVITIPRSSLVFHRVLPCEMRKVLNFSPLNRSTHHFQVIRWDTYLFSECTLFANPPISLSSKCTLGHIWHIWHGPDMHEAPHASGQLTAVWSHCWSCLNEIRRVSRQAGLSRADRGPVTGVAPSRNGQATAESGLGNLTAQIKPCGLHSVFKAQWLPN